MPHVISKLLTTALTAALLGIAACGHTPLQGAGPVVKAPVTISSAGAYREIRADGAFRLVVRSGEATSVTIEAEENLVPLFEARVDGGALVLTTERPFTSTHGMIVTVSGPTAAAARIGGAVTADFDQIRGDAVSVTATGASHVTVGEVAAKSVRAIATGASQVEFTGSGVESLEAKASGASQIQAKAACATAKLTAEGASSVTGPSAKRATAFVVGAATIDLDCSEHLQASAAGSSKITYGGEPKVEGEVGKIAVVSSRSGR